MSPKTSPLKGYFHASWLIFAFLFLPVPAGAAAGNGIESKISVHFAWEGIQYREREPDLKLETEAELNNMVIGFEGIKRWSGLFLAARMVLPVATEKGREEATFSAGRHQQNTLEMRWTRLDAYAGYPLRNWFNPYAGIRWSEVRQDRGDFFVSGVQRHIHARETKRSVSFLLGVGGAGEIIPRWGYHYRLELFLPLDVKVTNTALPGLEFTDRSGHAVELRLGVVRDVTSSITAGIFVQGGWKHWGGSEWKAFDRGRAKWPENDTYYLGAGMNVSYRFN